MSRLFFGCGWAFLMLADEVAEGETHGFDTALLLALRDPADPADPLGPPWVEELMRDVTALGGLVTLAAITLAVAVFLGLRRRRGDMWLVLAAVGGGQVLTTLFKRGFNGLRPQRAHHREGAAPGNPASPVSAGRAAGALLHLGTQTG